MVEDRPITGSTEHAWRGKPHKPHPNHYNECLKCRQYYNDVLEELRNHVDPFDDVMERTHSG